MQKKKKGEVLVKPDQKQKQKQNQEKQKEKLLQATGAINDHLFTYTCFLLV